MLKHGLCAHMTKLELLSVLTELHCDFLFNSKGMSFVEAL